MIKQAPFSLRILALALLAGNAVADDLFGGGQAVPEVLTATRLKQSPAAVPGSVTVLDSALIRASGARDLAELLRLVPGMMVGNITGNQATVNYHGSSTSQARRLQVMVDGRSVYRPGLATVDWSDIPVAIEDIERIEVFRGPNTVSYGANALLGVVNIFTRRPDDSQGTRIKVTRGQRGVSDNYASQSTHWDSGSLRLSASSQADDGFDQDDNGADYRDSRRLSRINLSVSQQLDERQTLDWQVAAKEASNQRPYVYEPVFTSRLGDTDSDVRARDYAGSLRWSFDQTPTHSVSLRTSLQHWERLESWGVCEGAIVFSPQLAELWDLNSAYVTQLLRNPNSISSGTSQEQALAAQVLGQAQNVRNQTVCGTTNQNIRDTRFDLELQDTLSLTDSLRLLSGLSYRHDQASSETYFNGTLGNNIWRLFGHLEWQVDEHWLLQGGAMFETDQQVGDSLTPRVSVNYLITPRHGLRAVYSEAVRSADMYENNVDWRYKIRGLQPQPFGQQDAYYFVHARGPGNLDQEIIRSHELGYNGQFNELGLSVDVKLFYDEIHNMIKAPRIDRFTPDNSDKMRFSGAETQIDWQLSRADRLRVTYAYIDFSATANTDSWLTARHSGSAGWIRDWGRGWSSSLFYYGADQLNQLRFERTDARLAKRTRLGSASLEVAGTLQLRLDDEALTWRENNYDDRHLLYLSAELEF